MESIAKNTTATECAHFKVDNAISKTAMYAATTATFVLIPILSDEKEGLGQAKVDANEVDAVLLAWLSRADSTTELTFSTLSVMEHLGHWTTENRGESKLDIRTPGESVRGSRRRPGRPRPSLPGR